MFLKVKMSSKDLVLWDKQFKFLTCKKKSALMQCGIGYGKTFVGAVFIVDCLQRYENCNYMIVARDIPQFKKAILPELLSVLNLFNYIENRDFDFNKSNSTFYFKKENVYIFCVGAVNYDSSFRGPNVAVIWSDETEYYKKEAWMAMIGRLRKKPELLRCTSTPNGFNFVSDFFVDNADDTKTIFKAPTYENKSLSFDYVNTLKQTYSPKLYQQEVEAERLNITVGKVYSEFSRDIHVKNCKDILTDTDTIYFFTDYNVAHYCGVYLVFKKGIVYCIGEEHLEYKQTKDMAYKVRSTYPKHHVVVCGDSTGNNKRDVAIERVNYAQFQDAGLDVMNFRNPPVHARIISANNNLYHQKAVIDPTCKTLIKDMELVSWKEGSNEIDKSNIDLSHASDAYTYGLFHFLSVKINRVSTQKIR